MKVRESIEDALMCINDFDTVMVGGFGLVGAPLTLIDGLVQKNIKGLTVISNNLGEQGRGLGILLNQRKVKKAIGSYFTSNRDVGDAVQKGELEVELLPQGTLAEAIRAGGAGIGGFYTKTALHTELSKGKEVKVIDDEEYLFEKALKADVAIIRALKADTLGNLTFYKTAQNFNPLMATAAKHVIVEVDEIVAVGELRPEEIVTPHLFINHIVKAKKILTNKGVVEVD